jgi:hypothetical protein
MQQHAGTRLAKRVMRSLAENQDVAGLHKMPTGVKGSSSKAVSSAVSELSSEISHPTCPAAYAPFFDAITGGGLPRNRTSLILGGPSGGKTVFALQTTGRADSASRASSSPSKRIPATFWQTPQASGGTSLNWKRSNSSFLMPRWGLT